MSIRQFYRITFQLSKQYIITVGFDNYCSQNLIRYSQSFYSICRKVYHLYNRLASCCNTLIYVAINVRRNESRIRSHFPTGKISLEKHIKKVFKEMPPCILRTVANGGGVGDLEFLPQIHSLSRFINARHSIPIHVLETNCIFQIPKLSVRTTV